MVGYSVYGYMIYIELFFTVVIIIVLSKTLHRYGNNHKQKKSRLHMQS